MNSSCDTYSIFSGNIAPTIFSLKNYSKAWSKFVSALYSMDEVQILSSHSSGFFSMALNASWWWCARRNIIGSVVDIYVIRLAALLNLSLPLHTPYLTMYLFTPSWLFLLITCDMKIALSSGWPRQMTNESIRRVNRSRHSFFSASLPQKKGSDGKTRSSFFICSYYWTNMPRNFSTRIIGPFLSINFLWLSWKYYWNFSNATSSRSCPLF